MRYLERAHGTRLLPNPSPPPCPRCNARKSSGFPCGRAPPEHGPPVGASCS
ncbi:hypothetical protein C882_0662 [Caenispirillum salinarum AK4]|uniref:Uncharacterized protein n=1 Tax=Caenispirillum salinarum AK4 TaxID=1238182 RepID=K9GVW6_9PROT|nr:hypothetical protein C882_0662 [Caenispirillum salinarum AK4]